MEIAKVDLRRVAPGGAGWEAASMVAHGCVVVAHDALGVDLRAELFSRALPELFALPLEVKQQTVSAKGKYRGYIGQIPGMAWERLQVGEGEPTDAVSVRGFAEILWPEGNPEFCETIVSFAKNMMKLEEMVETLVLEGLGDRGESMDAYFVLLDHGVRLSHYGVPPDTESSMSMRPHYEDSMMIAIVQHEVEGLELHVGDGRWVAVPAETGTFTFVAGEQFRVRERSSPIDSPDDDQSFVILTSSRRRVRMCANGRVPACLHRVRTPSNRERFSMLFGRRQKDGIEVRALEDLVYAEHPLVYNPLRHEEYSKWRYSEEGLKLDDPLKVYCGVEKVVGGAMA